MESKWGEWQGAMWRHLRGHICGEVRWQGDTSSTAELSWRRVARVVGGEWTEWRLSDWEAALDPYSFSSPLLTFRHVAIFSHPKKGWMARCGQYLLDLQFVPKRKFILLKNQTKSKQPELYETQQYHTSRPFDSF